MGYRGAGTVEFLYHPRERTFAFLEVNTRLQVEHPITELTTDVDLVKAQIHVAAGGRLEGDQPLESGHAVEARLNAEDPDRDFAPAPGRIALLELPAGPGIRVDTGVSEGDTIPADFDSMIAKIIAYGRTRDEALARLRRALAETTVVIEGGATNKSFVLDLLAQPEVIDGSADTGWIDRVRTQGRLVLPPARRGGAGRRRRSRPTRRRSRSSASDCSRRRTAAVRRPGTRSAARSTSSCAASRYRVTVAQIGPHRFRVGVGADGACRPSTPSSSGWTHYAGRLVIADQRFRLLTATHGPVQLVEVDGVTHRVSRDEGGVLRSPAPALVVATPVEVGAEVEAGRAGAGAGEHEDGDGAAGAVRGAGARAAGVLRQPGRDRSAARAPGAAAVTSRRPRPRRRRRPPPTSSCRRRATPRRTTGRSAVWTTCAACCSGSTSTPATRDAPCPATSPRGPS